jgi:AraC-like DNA-binding protein
MGYGPSASPGNPSTDRVRLVHDGVSGVEAIHARFAGHAYDLHRHDDWLVGVTEHGVQDFLCRGARRRSTPGRVILIEPQEAHDGQAGDPGGFSYGMLYLPRAWLKRALADTREADPGFRESLIDDPPLAAAIHHACAVLAAPDRLEVDTGLDTLVGALRPHLGRQTDAPTGQMDKRVARRARERLHDAMTENFGTDALAEAAGAADRFQLARAFRAAYGTSPHAYLVQIRLLSARQQLARGDAPAGVAAACGFADQSHFGRWFRRAYGVTPAAYRACCTNVPDSLAAIG